MKKSHQLINQNSNQVERYTPRDIVRAEIALMGHIDLDPACSDEAYEYHNAHAKARYSTQGLELPFYGNVHLNPPFGSTMYKWISKLVNAYKAGEVVQACIITFNCTETKWGQLLMRYPQYFFEGRVNYESGTIARPANVLSGQLALFEETVCILPDCEEDTGATKGTMLTFLPPPGMSWVGANRRLTEVFSVIGRPGWAK